MFLLRKIQYVKVMSKIYENINRRIQKGPMFPLYRILNSNSQITIYDVVCNTFISTVLTALCELGIRQSEKAALALLPLALLPLALPPLGLPHDHLPGI